MRHDRRLGLATGDSTLIGGVMTNDARRKRKDLGDMRSQLLAAAAACECAVTPERSLDAQIALAVFPALQELEPIGPAVWQHPDGTRVRALRYSFSVIAASTLVPPGCWFEARKGVVMVLGDSMNDVASTHPMKAIALSAAALRARILLNSAADIGLP